MLRHVPMRDPVTGFEYPKAWEERCRTPESLEDVARGLCVLTASGTVLRRGFTTGTTAAAACKAAILALDSDVSSVRITIPCGLEIDVPVTGKDGTARCKKFSGDYRSDATAGLEFVARASPENSGISLVPGTGIGIFSRDTPRFAKGTPAINPAPLACILRSMEEALETTSLKGVKVTLSIPRGAEVATTTLNPRVGIEGGISVLGTTGLVEPWDEHMTESVIDRISASQNVVLTTGRIGLRYAQLRYPEHDIILVGSGIDRALGAARGDVILFGLPALILRYICPHFLDGTGYLTVEEMSMSPRFGERMTSALLSFKREHPGIQVVIVNRHGIVIGETP
jgi:cobalt-precorrin-5B (C1)-methyltransferase